jgi:hypothetical protein
MKFTVVAVESVDDTLATHYMEDQAITDAADWIEKQLKNDPLSKVTAVDDLYSSPGFAGSPLSD